MLAFPCTSFTFCRRRCSCKFTATGRPVGFRSLATAAPGTTLPYEPLRDFSSPRFSPLEDETIRFEVEYLCSIVVSVPRSKPDPRSFRIPPSVFMRSTRTGRLGLVGALSVVTYPRVAFRWSRVLSSFENRNHRSSMRRARNLDRYRQRIATRSSIVPVPFSVGRCKTYIARRNAKASRISMERRERRTNIRKRIDRSTKVLATRISVKDARGANFSESPNLEYEEIGERKCARSAKREKNDFGWLGTIAVERFASEAAMIRCTRVVLLNPAGLPGQ